MGVGWLDFEKYGKFHTFFEGFPKVRQIYEPFCLSDFIGQPSLSAFCHYYHRGGVGIWEGCFVLDNVTNFILFTVLETLD